MNKNLRKFNQYKQVVHKTKDLQEDGASSSGSEGYKLWKKYKYYKYVRINLKNENQGDETDPLGSGASSDLDLTFEPTEEVVHPLQRSNVVNLDK